MDITYDGRRFRGRSNTSNGEVGPHTIFEYHQEGTLLWGTYAGGEIESGHLLGTVMNDGSLEFCYHHRSSAGVLMAGQCASVPRYEDDGTLVLAERWQWLTGDRSSGESEVEEVRPEPVNEWDNHVETAVDQQGRSNEETVREARG